MKCKACSKLKCFLVELGRCEPKDVLVSDKTFKAMLRIKGKLMHVADFLDDGHVSWVDKTTVNADACNAMDAFLSELQ